MKAQTEINDVIYNDIEDILEEVVPEQPLYYNESRREIINEIDVFEECSFDPFNCGGER